MAIRDLLHSIPVDQANQIQVEFDLLVDALERLMQAVKAQHPFTSQHVSIEVQKCSRLLKSLGY